MNKKIINFLMITLPRTTCYGITIVALTHFLNLYWGFLFVLLGTLLWGWNEESCKEAYK